MASPASSSSRRRSTNRQNSVEDQALSQINSEAESRLAVRRAARAEARDIRTRELERQKREEEEKEKEREGKIDRVTDLKKEFTTSRYISNGSRRGSFDTDEGRDTRKELYELEEKYKKSMMNNAQLDNEKVALRYQVDLLRDLVDDLTEQNTEAQRDFKEKSRELELKKRDYKDLEDKMKTCEELLRQRDELIKEHGLMFVNDETLLESGKGGGGSSGEESPPVSSGRKDVGFPSAALLAPDAVEILQSYSGTLNERLRKLADDKRSFEKEVKKLKQDLDDERERRSVLDKYSISHSPHGTPISNGPTDGQPAESQSDLQKQLSEYKLKLKRAEQEITTLEGNVVRLESQVKRFRTTAENLEKSEEELKTEKRKFQKELREALALKEELEMQNSHLQKRLDKLMKSRTTTSAK